MKIFVDGNALLDYFEEEQDPLLVAEKRYESRQNVRRWLARYAELRDCDVVLVWEETDPDLVLPPTERFGRVKVVNLPYGEEAVPEIAGPANRNAVEERTFVVTEDYRLANAIRRGQATLQDPDRFVRGARRRMGKSDEKMATEPDQKFTGLSEGEVNFWLDFFDEKE